MSHVNKIFNQGRRDFMTKVIPCCAIGMAALDKAFGSTNLVRLNQDEKHKFDSERTVTRRQLLQRQYGGLIGFGQFLKEDMGDKEAIELIKRYTEKRMLEVGKRQAERAGNNNFQTYVEPFKNPNGYRYSLTKEVVEDTDTVLELKVTECIWAATFLQQNAGDLGFAFVCHGDYAWPQGFNPKIKMIRDKTLMEGHAICNHRYIHEV